MDAPIPELQLTPAQIRENHAREYASAEADIDRTKRRQLDVLNYSTLAAAGIIGVVRLFGDPSPLQTWVLACLAVMIVLNAWLAIGAQRTLGRGMAKFRDRLFRARIGLGLKARPPSEKKREDWFFDVYFFGVPAIVAVLATGYLAYLGGAAAFLISAAGQ
ncbi:MAG: hypothetical protein QM773_09500 [Hyphomonadaceae bacterium]